MYKRTPYNLQAGVAEAIHLQRFRSVILYFSQFPLSNIKNTEVPPLSRAFVKKR